MTMNLFTFKQVRVNTIGWNFRPIRLFQSFKYLIFILVPGNSYKKK